MKVLIPEMTERQYEEVKKRKDKEEIYAFLSLISLHPELEREIPSRWLQEYLGVNNHTDIVGWCVEEGFITIDGRYVINEKCYLYSYVDTSIKFEWRTLIKSKWKKRCNACFQGKSISQIDRWCMKNLKQLRIDKLKAKQQVKNLKNTSLKKTDEEYRNLVSQQLDRVSELPEHSRDMYRIDSFSERRHTPITSLSTQLRHFLGHSSGNQLVNIDISNSQVVFLALKMMQDGINTPDFHTWREHVMDGTIYNELMPYLGITDRKEAKQAYFEQLLFCSQKRQRESDIHKYYKKHYPTVSTYIYREKAKTKQDVIDGNQKPYNKIARAMQEAECEFMFNCVLKRIKKERKKTFIATIHDSLICFVSESGYVYNVMLEEFKKLGVEPHIKTEQL